MTDISKDRARAVADVSEGVIVATVEIAAPAERVFRALTTGSDVTRWWGSPEVYRTTEWTGDVRPGGRWRAAGVGADGATFSVEGEYREVDPPRTLVHSWKAPWDGDHETVVSFRLQDIAGGTRLTLRHQGFADRVESCRGHARGWEQVLEWLVRDLAPRPDAKYFLCRLLPPRSTFPADMTAEEAEIMKKHGAYWAGLLASGSAVVFGPVADPRGAWGVGIVRAPNEDAVHALRTADPAIVSGRGFEYEILPMMRAFVRD